MDIRTLYLYDQPIHKQSIHIVLLTTEAYFDFPKFPPICNLLTELVPRALIRDGIDASIPTNNQCIEVKFDVLFHTTTLSTDKDIMQSQI